MTIFTSLVYLCYLVFQLFSHKNLYDDGHSDVQRSTNYPDNVAKRLRLPASRSPLPADVEARSEAGTVEEEEKPQMSIRMTIALLLVVTVVCRWSFPDRLEV
jgi:Ca2+:H+ antiporter